MRVAPVAARFRVPDVGAENSDMNAQASLPTMPFASSAASCPQLEAADEPIPRRARVLVIRRGDGGPVDETIQGVANYIQRHETWQVVVDCLPCDQAEMRQALAVGWTGVISLETTPELVAVCKESSLPLVDLADGPKYAGVPKVCTDYAAVGAMGAEFLLDRGFRELAFVGDGAGSRSEECREGFVEAAELAGANAVCFENLQSERWAPGRHCSEVRRLANWLARQASPLGVMAGDDRTGTLVLEAALSLGRQVPEEVAVLGCGNDVALCELVTPALSSVQSGAFEAGFLGARNLAALMARAPVDPKEVRVDPIDVVARMSTDVIAIQDRRVAVALRHIRDHACEGLTVPELLPVAAMSRALLEKRFRQYLGRSPQAEIRRVQIARIRKHLVESTLPLKRIAELTGFDYPEYMSVVFRRITGESPGAFRRRHRNRAERRTIVDGRGGEMDQAE